jgi:polysaccharide export outer membrane protein
MRFHPQQRNSKTQYALLLIFAGLAVRIAWGAPWYQQAAANSTQTAAPASATVVATSASVTPVPLLIGRGDELDISVYGTPDLTQHVRVNDAGDIHLPLVNYVHVEGLTSEQAENQIQEKLVDGGFLKNPQVTVYVKEYTNTGVSVLGEISRPGVYHIQGSRRLWDMILVAGGRTAKAGHMVSITHQDPKQPVTAVNISNDPVQSAQSNVEIMPGDTIVVSKAGIIYILGEVNQASGYTLEDGESMSVIKALALAHGPTNFAKLNDTRVLRTTAAGTTEQIKVPLRDVLEAKAHDILLKPEDIVFVPGKRGRYAGSRAIDTILSLATGVAIRAF